MKIKPELVFIVFRINEDGGSGVQFRLVGARLCSSKPPGPAWSRIAGQFHTDQNLNVVGGDSCSDSIGTLQGVGPTCQRVTWLVGRVPTNRASTALKH